MARDHTCLNARRRRRGVPHRPIGRESGLGVAALSYIGRINLGVFSDPAVCPDVEVFCEAARAARQDLAEELPPRTASAD
jgi:WS/DGAT C-terminal domain